MATNRITKKYHVLQNLLRCARLRSSLSSPHRWSYLQLSREHNRTQAQSASAAPALETWRPCLPARD